VQPSEITRVVGQNIRRRRTELDMTQVTLANGLGVAQAYVSELEAGKRTPSLAMLARLSEVLDIPPSHLVDSQTAAG